ncbi:MAG: hypothetical protein ACC628_27770, partial [Pirellulaceae bacterium]
MTVTLLTLFIAMIAITIATTAVADVRAPKIRPSLESFRSPLIFGFFLAGTGSAFLGFSEGSST